MITSYTFISTEGIFFVAVPSTTEWEGLLVAVLYWCYQLDGEHSVNKKYSLHSFALLGCYVAWIGSYR